MSAASTLLCSAPDSAIAACKPRTPQDQRIGGVAPEVAAGVADHIWTCEEIARCSTSNLGTWPMRQSPIRVS